MFNWSIIKESGFINFCANTRYDIDFTEILIKISIDSKGKLISESCSVYSTEKTERAILFGLYNETLTAQSISN